MKKKTSLSKVDYYLMFIDQFKDQFTIVLSINLLLFLVVNQFYKLMTQVFLQARFYDYLDLFNHQFELKDFFEYLSYVYLGAFIIHFMIYKLNKLILFRLNAFLLVLGSSYFWSVLPLENVLALLKNFHPFFTLAVMGQIFLYVIVGNEFFQLFKKTIKEPKINHS